MYYFSLKIIIHIIINKYTRYVLNIIFIYHSFCNIFLRPENTSFVVPKQAVHVPNLAIGDVVSFFHEGSRSGVLGPTIRPNSETTTEQGNDKSRPKLGPMIYRIRTDLLWEDVVRNYENEIRFLNGTNCII